MLLQLVPKLPEGEHWQYEVKWDGYRGIAVIQNGLAQLWSRIQRDLGKRFTSLVDALASLPVSSATIDGELVVLGDDGKPSFQADVRNLEDRSIEAQVQEVEGVKEERTVLISWINHFTNAAPYSLNSSATWRRLSGSPAHWRAIQIR